MEVHDYLPRIFDGESAFGSKKGDSSKWSVIHEAIDNPGSEVIVQSRSSMGSLFRIAWIVGIVLGLTWLMRNGKTTLTQWQQNMYRRANRRRHGIPDDDDRPFNVAYAAAALAKKEKQRAEREKSKLQTTADPRKNQTILRLRQPESSVAPIQSTFPLTTGAQTRLPVHDTLANYPVLPGGYLSDSQGSQQKRFIQSSHEPVRQRHLGYPVGPRPQEKHVSETTVEHVGESLRRHAPRRETALVPNRGFKRQVEEDDKWETPLDKRARVLSKSDEPREQEDVEMAPASSDIEPSKGTKRDREELESTPDSGADDTDESPRPRRIRQRTEPVERREYVFDGAAQTQKRRHSPEESTASDERDKNDVHISKHRRRHSKAVIGHDTTESEAEEYSEDPACFGRKIGEVWRVNEQTFKVGLDGRRLRQVLVKQRRSKFPMPRDSSHSDVKIDVQVYVEKWLNDEEYKLAKQNGELAWQDPAPPSSGTAELRQSIGKRLLWDGPPKSPTKGRKSMLPSSVPNPFDLAVSNAGRRASSVHTLVGSTGENVQLRTSRSFSKWEKQDLEALSLKKMRVRMEKEKNEQKEPQVKAEDKKDGFTLLGEEKPNPPPLSTITLPKSSSAVTAASCGKQAGVPASVTPAPAETISASIQPTSVSGTAPSKPVFSFAKDVESKPISGSSSAVTPSFTFNKPASEGSAPPLFQFGATSGSSSTTTPAAASPNIFKFGSPTAAAATAPAQNGSPGPLKPSFNFQQSTPTPGSTAPKPFNPSPGPTGASAAAPSAVSTSVEPAPKPFSFAPTQTTLAEPAQMASVPAQGSTPINLNFTASKEASKFAFSSPSEPKGEPTATLTGSLEAPKFNFNAAPKPAAPTTGFGAMATQAAGTAEPPSSSKFTFGQPATASFSQPTPAAFGFGRPATTNTNVSPASTPAASALAEPSQNQDSKTSVQPTNTRLAFGGLGGQATMTPPSFVFGATSSAENTKPVVSNPFASTAPNTEQSKTSPFGTDEPPKSIFGNQFKTDISKSTFGSSPPTGQSPFSGQASPVPPQNIFGQPSQLSNTGGQAPHSKNAFGPPSQSNPTFGQSSEPKSVFGQPPATSGFGQTSQPKAGYSQANPFGQPSTATEAPKNLFSQTSTVEPTKSTFGQASTSSTDTPKNIFGQVSITPPKSVFGQSSSSEPSKPAFGQMPASNSTFSFGSASTSTSTGSSGNNSDSLGNNSGFKFAFGAGTQAPSSSAGFGNTTSEDKPKISDQSKPADGVIDSSAKPTPVFGQTSVFSPSPASSPAFGSNSIPSPGSFGQTSGSNVFGSPSFSFGQASQPAGAQTPATQATTTPSLGAFSFNKPNEEQKK